MRTAVAWFFMAAAAMAQTSPQELGIAKLVVNGGTGTCVLLQHVKDDLSLFATAAHVVADSLHIDNSPISTTKLHTVEFADGSRGSANVSIFNRDADLAVLWVRKCPAKAVALEIDPAFPAAATERYRPPAEKPVVLLGYGMGKWMEHRGRVSFSHKGYVYSDAIAVSGQSGGALISDGKLLGIISGGSMWLTFDETKSSVTWPARCGAAELLPAMMEKALQAQGLR